MKKLFLLAIVVGFGFISCNKTAVDEPPVEPVDPTTQPLVITKAPTTFSQKALLEFTTCAGCTYCPDGEVYAENMIAKHGEDKLFVVALHNLQQGADKMSNTESAGFYTSYGNGNPSGFVNRKSAKCETRSLWDPKATTVLTEIAKCGLAIDATKKSGDVYTVKVFTGIAAAGDLPSGGGYSVVAYLVNDAMSGVGSGWDQVNFYNTQAGHKYFGAGSPAKGFIHENVFVKSLGTMTGTPLIADDMKAKALKEFSFDVDVTGMDVEKLHVVAFIALKGIGGHNIENVQRVALGKSQKFD